LKTIVKIVKYRRRPQTSGGSGLTMLHTSTATKLSNFVGHVKSILISKDLIYFSDPLFVIVPLPSAGLATALGGSRVVFNLAIMITVAEATRQSTRIIHKA